MRKTEEKKRTTLIISASKIKELKQLALDTDKTVTVLIDEAIRDILKKYNKK